MNVDHTDVYVYVSNNLLQNRIKLQLGCKTIIIIIKKERNRVPITSGRVVQPLSFLVVIFGHD